MSYLKEVMRVEHCFNSLQETHGLSLRTIPKTMVFILDGCSFHVAHEWWKQGLFPKKIEFDDSFDVTTCLQQIEMLD